jgi:4-carboxymuconolactone decarboxylase
MRSENMTRIPALSREEMDLEQQKVYDETVETTGRVGRGPSVGYAYAPGLWRVHNASSAHLLNCSLTPAQVRLVSLMTARHWNSAYPWSAQAAMALKAGVDQAVIEAINARAEPNFTDRADAMVHAVARELLASGTLGDEIFKASESTLGYQRLADVVGVIGHFSTTAMMANVVGAEPQANAPSYLKR